MDFRRLQLYMCILMWSVCIDSICMAISVYSERGFLFAVFVSAN